MKKVSCNLHDFLFGAALFVLCFSLFSCSNFNNADQTKKEIKAAIEYNNASSYTIRVDSDKNRGVVKSPAGGEAQKKVTDEFTVAFEPLPDYEFMTWKIIDSKTKTEYQNGEYLQLASAASETTTCKFVKAPPADVQLTLFAIVAKRPRVISVSPQSSDTGIYRDAKIRIVFDKKMEEKSIFFDTNEISSLKNEYELTDDDFVNGGDAANPKIYAYMLQGEKHYKNIHIVNQKTEESILNYYGVPYFEDPVTLIIPPDADNPPPGNTKITVTLDRSFSYLEGAKSIMLKEDYIWLYSVNSKIDKDAPEVMEELLVDDKGGAIAPIAKNAALPSEPSPLFKHKIKMYINIKDPASGPYNTFKIKLTNAQNANLVYEKEIGFDQLDVEEAYIGNKTVSGSNTEYTYTEYTFANDIPDGNYKLSFVYFDKNINPSDPDNYYYVQIDRVQPNVSNINLQTYEHSSSSIQQKTALKLTYNCSDYDHIVAKYRRTDGSGDWSVENTFTKGQDFIIPSLTYGVNYTVQAVFYDAAENSTTITQTGWTKLCEAKSLNVTTETIIQEDLWHNKVNSSTATLSWTGASGEFDSYTIKYMDEDGNVSSINNVPKNATTYTVTGLTPYKNYTFWITTIQNNNTTYPNGVDSDLKTKKMPIHIAPITTMEKAGSSSPYMNIRTSLSGQISDDYEVRLYYSKTEFTGDNPPTSFITMDNWGVLGYVTTNSNAKIKTSSFSDGVFEIGQQYWFAIKVSDKTNTSAFSWSDVENYNIVYTVENLRVDWVTGTKCKVIWDYPSGISSSNLTTKVYLIDSNSNKTEKDIWTGKQNPRYTIENLTRNTDYTVEVELIYNNVAGSLTLPVTTKDIALQTGFANNASMIYKSNTYRQLKFEWDYPSEGISPHKYIIQCKKEGAESFGIAYNSDDETMGWNFQNDGLKYENESWNCNMVLDWTNTSHTKLSNSKFLQEYFWYQNGSSRSGASFYPNDEYYDFLITGYIYDSATNSVIEVVSDCITFKPK